MRGAPCVVSVAEHTGWAHVICVAAPGLVPVVIARRRVTLIDPGLPTMPYEHESVGMKEAEANALIARVRRSIAARTTLALQRLVTELSPTYAAVALAIRKPPFPELPGTVRAVWKSYVCNAPPTGCCISWPSATRPGSLASRCSCAAVAMKRHGRRSA